MVANDPILISIACLHAAGKVADAPKSLKSILKAAFHFLTRNERRRAGADRGKKGGGGGRGKDEGEEAGELNDSDDEETLVWIDGRAEAAQMAAVRAERMLLYELGFRFERVPAAGVVVEILGADPAIVKCLKEKESMDPSSGATMNVTNIAYQFALVSSKVPLTLQYAQSSIGAACVWLAMKMLGSDMSSLEATDTRQSWWSKYGLSSRDLEAIAAQISECMKKEKARADHLESKFGSETSKITPGIGHDGSLKSNKNAESSPPALVPVVEEGDHAAPTLQQQVSCRVSDVAEQGTMSTTEDAVQELEGLFG